MANLLTSKMVNKIEICYFGMLMSTVKLIVENILKSW